MAIPNGMNGILVMTPNVTIGGDTAADGNVISGNGTNGIQVIAPANNPSFQFLAKNNLVGTNSAGTAAIGNSQNGISVSGPADLPPDNIKLDSNLVSGNGGVGINTMGSTIWIKSGLVGTNAAGTAAIPNSSDGIRITAPAGLPPNSIKVTDSTVSGNGGNGIVINQSSSTAQHTVHSPQGGVGAIWISSGHHGTNRAGTAALPNQENGILIRASEVRIGGTTAAEANVIGGNTLDGIKIEPSATGEMTDSVRIESNYIGTDATGAVALGNRNGISIEGTHSNLEIGGALQMVYSIITANREDGIRIVGSSSSAAVVSSPQGGFRLLDHGGLRIGTNAPQNIANSPNGGFRVVDHGGLRIGTNAPQNIPNSPNGGFRVLDHGGLRIGTNAPQNIANSPHGGFRVVNSGGLRLGTEGQANVNSSPQGGFRVVNSGVCVGNNALNKAAVVAPGNAGNGISIIDSDFVQIGDSSVTTNLPNIIGGNGGNGIEIRGTSSNNLIEATLIGVEADGTANGNAGHGIFINGATGNTIGGLNANQKNTIANNGGDGIRVVGPSTPQITLTNRFLSAPTAPTSTNQLLRNAIQSNAGLGIDLGGDGVTPNDLLDVDSGPNGLLNFPVINQVNASAIVQGTYSGAPIETLTLDFYWSAGVDASGYGEGKNFLGSTMVMTNAAGSASYNFNFPQSLAAGVWVTATATDSAGNTSEFAQSKQIGAPTAAAGTIVGRIITADGAPVSGAVVGLSGRQTRKTITDAGGNYHFDNVETNGFYTVTPARANYNFSPANRSFSQTGSHTEAAFTATSSGEAANPLDTPEYFVRQQYVDVLGREPDEAGFNYWSDQINQCLSEPPAVAGGSAPGDCLRSRRVSVAAAFFIEQEFQQTGSFIYDLYKGALGRRPVFAEYSTDRRQVIGGANLDSQKTAFAQAFVQRTEFANKYQAHTTAASFVDALIENLQQVGGVDLNNQRDQLISIYNRGGEMIQSRALVVHAVADDAAFKQSQYNSAFVLTEYFGYLRRTPEQGGYDFWLNVLNDRDPNNYSGMVCAFITSTEYQRRFSNVVSHSNNECGP